MIEVRGLTLAIPGGPLITGLDLDLPRGGRVGLTGRSGLGKTVLVDAIVRAAIGERSLAILEGELRVAEGPIGYGPQRLGIPRWFRVGDLLKRLVARAPQDRRADLEQMRRALGLDQLADSYPRTLSGGEMQRLSLMVALCLAADLLILDEPLTALDLATKTELLKRSLSFLCRHGIALLVVSHDLDVLLALAQEVHVLSKSGIAATVTVDSSEGQGESSDGDHVRCRAELLAILRKQAAIGGVTKTMNQGGQ